MRVEEAEAYGRMAYELWDHLPAADQIWQNKSAPRGESPHGRRSAIASIPAIAEAGFADISLRDYVDGATLSPRYRLEGIRVAPQLRRTGVGAALIAFVEDWVKQQSYLEMTSDTALENITSQHFHTQWGFYQHQRIVQFRMSLEQTGE